MDKEIRQRWRGDEVKPLKLHAIFAKSETEYVLWFEGDDSERIVVTFNARGVSAA